MLCLIKTEMFSRQRIRKMKKLIHCLFLLSFICVNQTFGDSLISRAISYVVTKAKKHPIVLAGSATVATGLYYYYVYKPNMAAAREQDQKMLTAIKHAVEKNDFILSVLESTTIDTVVGAMRSLSGAQRVQLTNLAKAYDEGLMEGHDMAEIRTQLLDHINGALSQ